ncbi:hypothetical protein BSL78_22832, partial [Apostichopus japonicus]
MRTGREAIAQIGNTQWNNLMIKFYVADLKVTSILPPEDFTFYHIGLIRIDQSSFKWDDGTVTVETNWAPAQPTATSFTELCVVVHAVTLEWYDRPCNVQSGFICERPVNHFCSGIGTSCQNGGSCTEGLTAAQCDCPAGWTGSTCDVDVNECSSAGLNNCDANAACTNTEGSFMCTCNDGYQGDGVSCQ